MHINVVWSTNLQVKIHKGSAILLQHRLEALWHETNTEQTSVIVGLFLLHHLNETHTHLKL